MAEKLVAEVEKDLRDLNMEQVKFEVHITPNEAEERDYRHVRRPAVHRSFPDRRPRRDAPGADLEAGARQRLLKLVYTER